MNDCQRMDAALAADPAMREPALEAHLESCERCRWVRERFGQVLVAPPLSETSQRPVRIARGVYATGAALALTAILFMMMGKPFVNERAMSPPTSGVPVPFHSLGREDERLLEQSELRVRDLEVGRLATGSDEERAKIRAQLAQESARQHAPRSPHAHSTMRLHDTDDPLGGFSYGQGAPPAAAAARSPTRGDEVDALLNHATRGQAGPPATGLQKAMNAIRPGIQACHAQHRVAGIVQVKINILRNGRIKSARVTGKFAGTPTGVCVEEAVRGAIFPTFSGPPIEITYPFVLQGGLGGGSGGGGGVPPLDPNAYLQNNYSPGAGARDRTEALVAAGVTVGDTTLKLDTFTQGLRQRFVPPTEAAIGLHATLERTHAKTKGDVMALQVGLQATDRAPRPDRLNVVLVIDVSGSMAEGDKLGYAKQAALDLYSTLRPSDRVAVVAYSDMPRVVIAPGPPNREEAAARIGDLVPESSTNIHEAMVWAYRIAATLHQPSAVTRVLLLSDGQANVGETEHGAFAAVARDAFERGITTTSVGVGLEYDDQLMSLVASAGRGSYHFLADPAAISEAMRREVQSLSRAVAGAVLVRINLQEGVIARRVIGQPELDAPAVAEVKQEEKMLDVRAARERGIAKDRGPEDGPGLKTLVPHFYAATSHVMMLDIELPPGVGRRKVAEVVLRYKDLVKNKNVTERAEVFVDTTTDAAFAARSFDPRVRRNVIAFRTAEELLAAAADVESGRAGVAARRVADQHALLQAAARRFEDADLLRDADLLGRYRDALFGIAEAHGEEARRYLALTFRSSAHALCR